MKRDFDGDADVPLESNDTEDSNTVSAANGSSAMVQEVMGAGTPAVESTTARMWFSNQHAGTIIGKGGTNIKSIRDDSSCKVMIAESPHAGADRLITVIGPPLSVNRAVELMLEKVETADTAATPDVTYTHLLRLCLSNNQVGAIIGKGGATIKSVRETSNAAIKVVETPPNAAQPERLVTVGGSRAEVVHAHQMIVLKLATVPEEAPPNHPSKYQRTAVAQMPRGPYYGAPGMQHATGQSYGLPAPPSSPYVPPPGYAHAYSPQFQQQQQPPYGAQPQAALSGHQFYAPPAYSGQPASYGGQARQQSPTRQHAPPAGYGQAPAQPMGQPSYGGAASTPAAGYAFASYGTQSYGGGGAGAPSPSNLAGGSFSAPTPTGGADGEMMQLIPAAYVGRLIGKGGSGIRELRDLSRAQIRVQSECEPGTEQRKVTVSGPPEAVGAALAMISQKLAQGP